MKLAILLDENSKLEKEEALKELAMQESIEFVRLSNLLEASHFLSANLDQKTILCDHSRFLSLDLTKTYVNTRFVILVTGKISDITTTVPGHLEANIFLAEDLLGTNELGKTLLRSAILWKNDGKIDFEDLIKKPLVTKALTLSESADKNKILEAIETIVMEAYTQLPQRLAETYAQKAAMICDELILNAIYDANPRLKSTNRQINTTLEAHETVAVNISVSESVIALSVKDKFGTFKKDSMLRYVSGTNQSEKISDRQSGGMGLRLSIDSSSQMLVQVEEGRYTEMISVINIYPSIKEFRQKLKSLLCFFN